MKRPFDKFSHSAAGHSREGGREKKGGQGPRNWGTKDTSPEVPLDASADAPEEEKVEETPADNVEGKAEEEVKEEAEEEKEIDFRTFLERKRKEEEESNQIIAVEIRKVEAIQDLKPLVKEEEDFFPVDGKKKASAKKANQSSGNKVNVDEVLNVQAPRENRDDRRGGRGRGGKQDRQRQPRGGRGSSGQSAQLSLNDDHDFPSLGLKA